MPGSSTLDKDRAAFLAQGVTSVTERHHFVTLMMLRGTVRLDITQEWYHLTYPPSYLHLVVRLGLLLEFPLISPKQIIYINGH